MQKRVVWPKLAPGRFSARPRPPTSTWYIPPPDPAKANETEKRGHLRVVGRLVGHFVQDKFPYSVSLQPQMSWNAGCRAYQFAGL